jgi:hypothetical protein
LAGRENALIHQRRIADDRPKLHQGQEITIDINAGRDFDQLDAVRR